MATPPADEFDLGSAIAAARAAGAGTSSNPAVVPLWKVRPKAPTTLARGGRDSSEWNAVLDARQANPSAFAKEELATVYGVTSDAAESSWLDMADQDKVDFLKLAKSAGLVSGNVSPAELASAWAKAVATAKAYNANQSNKQKWISPWDAVKKLALQDAAKYGGAFNGYSSQSQAGTWTNRQSNAKVYSSNQLSLAAESIARELLGRAPTADELAKYTNAVNKASALHPEITDQTVTRDEAGNTTTTTATGGGIDANAVMADETKRNPEYARAQAAMTYLPALMNALSAPV